MGDCATPAEISDIASKDTSRIVGSIAKCLAANSPYINVFNGGTFPSGVSDEVRSVVQLQAAPGDSLAEPEFTNDTEICGTTGTQELTDTTEYVYRLQSKRGKGPRICVKKGYAAFKDSYLRAEDSLAKLITQYINADIRAATTRKSASKFVTNDTLSFLDAFTGGDDQDIDVQFAQVLPNAGPSFKALRVLTRFMREALFAEMYPAGDKAQAHFKVIGEPDVIDNLREEAGVKDIMLALAQGQYKLGENTLTAYSWETSPAFRGLAFASDQRNQRASGFDEDGNLELINPVHIVSNPTKNTAYAKVNPAWLTAPYGVLHVYAQNTFERLVPEKYVGEGSFKFAPQLHMGELDWFYQRDNDCNIFGDFGHHIYQITRAYKPVRPQHVASVLYKRCVTDLDLTACEAESELESTASL